MIIGRIRRVFFLGATLALIAAIVADSWFVPRKEAAQTPFDPAAPAPAAAPAKPSGIEEQILQFQAKFTVQLVDWIRESRKSYPQYAHAFDAFERDMEQSLSANLGKHKIISSASADSPAHRLLKKELILAHHLDIAEARERICTELQMQQDTSAMLLKRLCGGEQEACAAPPAAGQQPAAQAADTAAASCAAEYSEDDAAILRSELGWFADLLLSKTAASAAQRQAAASRIAASGERKAVRLIAAGSLILFVVLFSVIFLLSLAIKVIRGRLYAAYTDQGMPAWYSLEIFCLYLAAMYLLPKAAELLPKLGVNVDRLMINAAAIPLAACAVFWPLLWGVKLHDLRQRLGVFAGGFSRFFRDVVTGPYAYLSSLPLLALILMIYAGLLMHFDVDPSSGTHPIVPIITNTSSKKTVGLVIFLAAVLAPLIEELMFRGAFYSWLRSRLGAFTAIFVSSVTFAALHPQGAIGLVPLTCIGFVLAFLREWRGNLTACVVAHACYNGGTLLLVMLLLR